MFELRLKLRRTLSHARLKALGAMGVRNGQHCCACDTDVPGFYYRSYRPFGCPSCSSSPRERFVMYALKNGLIPPPEQGSRVLHLAPGEKNIIRYLRSFGEWIGGDIDPKPYGPDVVYVDLTTMSFEKPFDLIYASHVLEHIPDDRLAMRQIRDHLTPSGCAVILVPLRGDETEEGGPDLSAQERHKRFGQWDHVRQYGMDIVERLEGEGLSVTILDSKDTGSQAIKKYGFETHGYDGHEETDRIFLCRRRDAS